MATPQLVAQIYRETQSLKQTADYFGKSSYWVRFRLAEAGEPVNPPTQKKFDIEVAQALRNEGLGLEAIAQKLVPEGLSHGSVRKRLIKHQQSQS